MPPATPTIELAACLIVDNNLLCTLAEYYCEHVLPSQPAAQKAAHYKHWMSDMLGRLRTHAPDQCLHSTQPVVDEFKPSGALYACLPPPEHQSVLKHVRGLLQAHAPPEFAAFIPVLRNLPKAPGHLLKAGGVSDNDLSLAALGAVLTQTQPRVYVLSHDQDLLSFISWFRTQPSAKQVWPDLPRLQAYHGLSYLENLHRSCAISTDEMKALIQFALAQEFKRAQQVGPEKGLNIFQTLLKVNDSLTESAVHKLRQQQQRALQPATTGAGL